ncbi:MAG: DUF4931 domain-containing protein, partial [Patescibacteria group bacterium]
MSNSELRRDVVSGEWVIIAPRRVGRPLDFSHRTPRKKSPKKMCPFENPQATEGGAPLLVRPKDAPEEWTLQIIQNKYPALEHGGGKCASFTRKGFYEISEGVGYHRVLVLRAHEKNIPDLSKREVWEIFDALQEHYHELMLDPCVEYVSMFQNWGPSAGASIYHPHLQIIGIPVVPTGILRSLEGSRKYKRKHHECPHCTILDFEIQEKKRILYASKNVIAFAPFVSREAYEFRIFPRRHNAYFENEKEEVLSEIADVVRRLLGNVRTRLGDPDYNFLIHSAPV